MVLRLSEETVSEPNDLAEIKYRYQRLPGEDVFEPKPHTWSKIDQP